MGWFWLLEFWCFFNEFLFDFRMRPPPLNFFCNCTLLFWSRSMPFGGRFAILIWFLAGLSPARVGFKMVFCPY